MSQNDDTSFYREVDEDYRREQMVQFWKRYGTYIIGAALLIAVGVLAYTYNKQRNQANAARGGDALVNVFILQDQGKTDEAKKALAALAENGSATYQILARLQNAGESVAKGQRDAAIENYRAVVNDDATPIDLKHFAQLQLAAISIDTSSYDKLAVELAEHRSGTGHWRFLAKEVLGLAAFKDGKKAEAEKLFGEIRSDGAAPPGMRQRAEIMLALLLEKPKAAPLGQAAKGETPNAAKTQ